MERTTTTKNYKDMQNSMNEKLSLIKKLLEDKKAENIVVLDVSKYTNIADYFVISTATSPIHARALADYLRDELEKHGYLVDHTEGFDSANWILVDLVDVIVHIFQEDYRNYYDLEWLYSGAQRIEL